MQGMQLVWLHALKHELRFAQSDVQGVQQVKVCPQTLVVCRSPLRIMRSIQNVKLHMCSPTCKRRMW